MLQYDLLRGDHGRAHSLVAMAFRGPNLPHRVVGGAVEEADLLVAGEASKCEWRDGVRGQVERLVADKFVGDDAHAVAIADGLVGGRGASGSGLSADEMHNGARASTHITLSGGHSIGLVTAGDTIAHVAHEPPLSQTVLKHDSVTELKSAVGSERVGHLQNIETQDELKATT